MSRNKSIPTSSVMAVTSHLSWADDSNAWIVQISTCASPASQSGAGFTIRIMRGKRFRLGKSYAPPAFTGLVSNVIRVVCARWCRPTASNVVIVQIMTFAQHVMILVMRSIPGMIPGAIRANGLSKSRSQLHPVNPSLSRPRLFPKHPRLIPNKCR
mmetsp:Transcript_66128/g.146895  ORF Transcript_66128/g.146895 Transcript_66128/m.146895 type:complete len:156 (+) Transcript_66128:1155-1622(+)